MFSLPRLKAEGWIAFPVGRTRFEVHGFLGRVL